jgi:hypothetical protein
MDFCALCVFVGLRIKEVVNYTKRVGLGDLWFCAINHF